MKLAALNEIIEEVRVRLQPAMRHAFDYVFQFLALRPRQQRDARAFNRGVADLQDFCIVNVRNQTDAF